jgi:hypothetical protein
MSVDVLSTIDTITGLATAAILLFAVYRAVEIGRGLVNRVYRNRAYLTGALIVFLVLQSFVPQSPTIGNLPLFELSYFVLLFVILAFADSSIMVALDMDFFHRNTLGWRQGRLPLYIIMLLGFADFLVPTYLGVTQGVIANFAGAAFVGGYGYTIAALVAGARRTTDRPMRSFIAFLGIFVLCQVVTTLAFNYTSIPAVDLLSDFLSLTIAYSLYRMTMSLSPVGRVEKSIATEQQSLLP